ncbi:MBL fold metallo-hydrolase [Haliangium sp.]|uniref:MBL fold metallo-hydrolase n=1 Tax=Haliangium sp. TaxID=2663208 RepID=UPI003D11110D
MKLRFWGVRGTFSACGSEFLRYGGNTAAVELITDAGQRVLIDLGTGATGLAKELMAGEFGRGEGRLPILLSHTHLDHIQGLPFFTPFFVKGNQIRIIGAEPTGAALVDVLQDKLNPHYSPLYGLENLAAGVSIETVQPGDTLAIEGFVVRTVAVPHGDLWSLAFRLDADDRAVAYVSGVEYPDDRPSDGVLALAEDVDLLIHDGAFTDEPSPGHLGWGHSPVTAAIEVAERSRARRLALFHHSPDATDDDIDELVAYARERSEVPLMAASEGSYITL